MGQQPFLILSFCIVLVGGLVVLGAHFQEQSNTGENRDFVIEEALSIVNHIQEWKAVPTRFGGAADTTGFAGLTFPKLGYRPTLLSKRVYKTESGCYALRTIGPKHQAVLTISAPSCSPNDYMMRAIIEGPTSGDLYWER